MKASSLQGSNEELALEFAKTAVAAREKSAYGLQDFIGQAKGLASGVDWKGLGQKAMDNPEITGALVGTGIGGLSALRDRNSRSNILQHMLMGAATGGAAGFGSRLMNQASSRLHQDRPEAPITSAEDQVRDKVKGMPGAWAQDAADNELSSAVPVSPADVKPAVAGGAAGLGATYGVNRYGRDARAAKALREGNKSDVGGLRGALKKILGKDNKPNWGETTTSDVQRYEKILKNRQGNVPKPLAQAGGVARKGLFGLGARAGQGSWLQNALMQAGMKMPSTTPQYSAARDAFKDLRRIGNAGRPIGLKGMTGATAGGAGVGLLGSILYRRALLDAVRNDAAKQLMAGQ